MVLHKAAGTPSATFAQRIVNEGANSCPLPEYQRKVITGFPKTGIHNALRQLISATDPCPPHRGSFSEWNEFLSWMQGTTGPIEEPFLSSANEAAYVIPFSPGTERRPLGSLGTFILWDTNLDDVDLSVRDGILRPVTKLLSASVTRFLKLHYSLEETTYLPSYRCQGPKNVSVMFADIRNFTPTTEIMRNFNLVPQLVAFMHKFCFAMGEIVRRHGGRVQSYAGDGVMALFGEYLLKPEDSVAQASSAAHEMYQKFEELQREFLSEPILERFFRLEYEPIEFGLGIGINYGQVIFDYFGPPNARVFSPVGDHVNFAQRLESEASRFDAVLGRYRSPILFSRPAWAAMGKPNDHVAIHIQAKGKPLTYQAYEFPLERIKKTAR